VALYSQNTNKIEANYHSFELEMLAVVKSVERFHIYLYGLDFTVVTDCHALVYALKVNKVNINLCIALKLKKTTDLKSFITRVAVDALSRIVVFAEAMPLEKELQYKQLQDPKFKICLPSLNEKTIINSKFSTALFLEKARISLGLPYQINNIIRVYHDNITHCGLEKNN